MSIAELSIAEGAIGEGFSGSPFVPVETTLLLERRPVMTIGAGFFRADMGDDFDGVAIVTELERVGWTITGANRDGSLRSDPGIVKLLTEVWPVIRGEAGTEINVYVGSQAKTTEDEIVWQGPFLFVVGQTSSIQPIVRGAYLAIKFVSNDQTVWSLLSLDVDIVPDGEVYD